MKEMLPAIATGLFALGGVLLTSFLERWRRKEQRANTLFDKKLEAYSDLMREAHEITIQDLITGNNQRLKERGTNFILKFGNYSLFTSPKVTELAIAFGSAAADSETEYEKKRDELGTLHRELRNRCQQELGIACLGEQRGIEEPE